MLTEEDLKAIEDIVNANKTSGGGGCLLILFILFILGIFKGCGY